MQKPLYQQKSQRLYLNDYSADGYCAAIKSIHMPEPQSECEASTRKHAHAYYELSIVVNGDGEHWHEGQVTKIAPGQVFLITPGDYHYYKGFSYLTLQNFMFSKNLLRSMRPLLKQFPSYEHFFVDKVQPKLLINSTLISEFETLLQNIGMEYQKSSCQNKLLLFSYIAQLLSKLLAYKSNYINSSQGQTEKLLNVLAYMKQNFNKDITMEKLAQLAHVSTSTLYRLFYHEFSVSPMNWLLKLRLTKARELLMHTEKSINEVAYACGYNDPHFFSRQFRKSIGCSPRQYRTHGQGEIEILRESHYTKDLSFLP